jgi:uncharacterized protein YjiS (DUF1127 family)
LRTHILPPKCKSGKIDRALTMTISQPTSEQRPDRAGARPLAFLTCLLARFVCWRERRRVAAELARLAAIGDYLLRDIGLDTSAARSGQPAALKQLLPRKPIA